MKSSNISIAEGKKGFSRIISEAQKKNEDIIVTKRGKPVAAIIPYDEYLRSKRTEAYRKIMEARETFLKAGLSSDEIFEESKKQREKRP